MGSLKKPVDAGIVEVAFMIGQLGRENVCSGLFGAGKNHHAKLMHARRSQRLCRCLHRCAARHDIINQHNAFSVKLG